MTTVSDNMQKFTEREIKDARVARDFQNNAGLSTQALLRMIDSGLLINSPITRKAVRDSIAIWGISEAHLKGKTTRTRGDAVIMNDIEITTIPPHILEHHKNIIIGMDITKVNKIPFLATISRVIKFGTGSELKIQKYRQ